VTQSDKNGFITFTALGAYNVIIVISLKFSHKYHTGSYCIAENFIEFGDSQKKTLANLSLAPSLFRYYKQSADKTLVANL